MRHGTSVSIRARLSSVDLLVLEDLGARRLQPTGGGDLLEVMSRSYERGATILASNRPIEDFGAILGDAVAAGVLLDCFLHAEVVTLTGKSYRLHERAHRRELLSPAVGTPSAPVSASGAPPTTPQ